MSGTVVCGRYAPGSSFDPHTFDDLTDAAVVEGIEWAGPVLCVTFADDLDDQVAAAVRLRIVSPSRQDEAARASLLGVAEVLVAQDPTDPLAVLVRDALELVLRPHVSHEGIHE